MIVRYGQNATLERSEKVLSRIGDSVAVLQEKLAAGELIYGECISSLILVTFMFRPSSYNYTLYIATTIAKRN